MKNVWLLYRSDEWLSVSKKELLGIYEDGNKAVRDGVKDCMKPKENVGVWMKYHKDMVYTYGKRVARAKMKESVADDLQYRCQTQGYVINYIIECHKVK